MDFYNYIINICYSAKYDNIIFGCIIGILICLFLKEENIFKINSIFFKFLEISLIILGIINSFYHIGYAIFNLVI